MPLAQYFFFVGGLMLALLFVLDAFIPKSPAAVRTAANLPVIRIHSDWKLPEPVVIDTSSTVPARITIMESNVPAALRVVVLFLSRDGARSICRASATRRKAADPLRSEAAKGEGSEGSPQAQARFGCQGVLWVSGTPHGSATALWRVSSAVRLAWQKM